MTSRSTFSTGKVLVCLLLPAAGVLVRGARVTTRGSVHQFQSYKCAYPTHFLFHIMPLPGHRLIPPHVAMFFAACLAQRLPSVTKSA